MIRGLIQLEFLDSRGQRGNIEFAVGYRVEFQEYRFHEGFFSWRGRMPGSI
jgi:hypothetical protein